MLPWLMNTMAGILRGTGNMKLPSLMILNSAVCQIILGGTLGLGLGPIPQFGMRGVAAGSLIAYSISISVMAWYLFSGRARVVPRIRGLRIQWAMFVDILKVGAVSCFSPLQSVLTISIFTHMLARFGTADPRRLRHRRAARIHADLGCVRGRDRVGADDRHGDRRRSHRARAADRLDRGLASRSCRSASIATVIAIFPDLWVNIFTRDPGVRAASRQYLSTAAPMYAFIGLAISMYFSSQGAAKVLGPVLAQTARLVFIAARRLVAVDARRDRGEFLRAGGGLDGGARRVVRRPASC